MIRKNRKLIDSKTKNKKGLADTLTNNQYNTIGSLLNVEYKGMVLYDPRVGGFYKKNMIPCTLNDLHKALDKKVDKMFRVLQGKKILNLVQDIRGRYVWMINPDLYWDNVTYELYYNRWLFHSGSHRLASEAVNLSLHYGYYYNPENGEAIKKIPRYHWIGMCKWWLLIDNEHSTNLLTFDSYQPPNQ